MIKIDPFLQGIPMYQNEISLDYADIVMISIYEELVYVLVDNYIKDKGIIQGYIYSVNKNFKNGQQVQFSQDKVLSVIT